MEQAKLGCIHPWIKLNHVIFLLNYSNFFLVYPAAFHSVFIENILKPSLFIFLSCKISCSCFKFIDVYFLMKKYLKVLALGCLCTQQAMRKFAIKSLINELRNKRVHTSLKRTYSGRIKTQKSINPSIWDIVGHSSIIC